MLNFTIHRKLILSYVLLAVLPTIVLGAYLSGSIKTLTVNRTLNDAVKSVEIIQSEFYRSLNVPVDVSRQLYLNQNFSRLIEKQYSDSWDVVSSYFLFKDFEGLQKIYANQIDNIRIYVGNDTILESWYLCKITEEVMETDWYNLAVSYPSRVIWCPTFNSNAFSSDKNCYSLVRLIEFPGEQAILLIDLNKSYINNLLKTEYFDITIFDEKGNIVCANNPERAEQNVREYAFDTYEYSDKVMIRDSEDDEGKHKIILKDMNAEGVNGRFRIVSSFLLEDILYESNMLFIRYIFITLACLLFIITLVIFFSRKLRRRVAVLRNEMELVSKGDFTLVSTITGKDEIGILSKSLNIMAENLKKLVEENYEANYQKQSLVIKHNDIKLKLLTNQINPHFLFNTLESLRMEARIRNETEISDIIRRLGGLLRKSIQTGSDELPLTDEISLVEDYLRIQAFRYGDRIQYSFSISEESRGLKILPFLIQPIVENAIVHGLENSEETGMILVNTFCDDKDLTIEVQDNGVGMSPEKLQEIRESLNDEETDDLHIGIRNVHWRIRLRYGPSYGLTIENEDNKYTKVSLRIPKVVMSRV